MWVYKINSLDIKEQGLIISSSDIEKLTTKEIIDKVIEYNRGYYVNEGYNRAKNDVLNKVKDFLNFIGYKDSHNILFK